MAIEAWCRPNGDLFNADYVPYVQWSHEDNDGEIILDGEFTIEELRAIVSHVEKHAAEKKRDAPESQKRS